MLEVASISKKDITTGERDLWVEVGWGGLWWPTNCARPGMGIEGIGVLGEDNGHF